MCQKRYDIIRVDKHCPNWYQKDIDQKFLCDNQDCTSCDGCRYGDTKEQLVRKVAQVLKRKADLSNYNKGAKFCYNLHFKYCENLAKEIIEFLGIKDE